ncbi:3-dehydroquinate synthase [Parvularcula marina]|uniref:3-dehydroquinate synthase n=1 Tax=Parvularcula marina TaxID=2292771 RepID=A0A371R7S4_9PROT|nr:3-dehydroquinate synthase [Parvularcula marina]RFB01502.1 3-dehydroquinate synthase [Parvularcula marina]
MTLTTVNVALGPRSYDIVIGTGALSATAERLTGIIGKGQPAIIADEKVWGLHKDALLAVTGDVPVITVPSGEASKSFASYERVMEALLAADLGRDGTIIAFGGGVVGDLAGFCAATLKRGCQFVQVPTTLLAQVDSSVGGKTAINSAAGKNLVGAFYQPKLVIIDTDLLKTLPERELKAGYAEVLKYGLLGDEVFFGWLETAYKDILELDPLAVTRAIETSCREKARLVAADEQEASVRALLNLGHTFGHAIEAEAGYGGDVLHGEGVAIGMAMAFRYSTALGRCPGQDTGRVEAHLKSAGMPASLADHPGAKGTAEALLSWMGQDKKNVGGRLKLILARGIGDTYITDDVDPDHLLSFLKQEPGIQPS